MEELKVYISAGDSLSRKLSLLSGAFSWDQISDLRNKKSHIVKGNKITIATTKSKELEVFILGVYAQTQKVLIYNQKSRKRYFVPYYKIR
tara:strand:- start:91 stop:360 length:270 start_codon:yes stop_codon:yes gene_type:complete